MNLNELARPRQLQHVVGQEHLVGEGSLFLKILGRQFNLIFYGPSGTGKTSVAKIVAKDSGRLFYSFNATECSVDDVKKAIESSRTGLFASSAVLIYIDEIQYFNKKQQQRLLGYLDGKACDFDCVYY